MMLVSAATIAAPVTRAKINATAVGGTMRKMRSIRRRLGRSVPVRPAPSSVVVLAHGFPFPAIAQNVADRDEQQDADKRSNNQKDFQGFLLKSGSNQNV